MKNIAFKLPNMDSWPVERVYEHCGVPETQEIIRYDGKPLGPEVPPYAVFPTIFHGSENLPLGEISILDFGEASFATTEPRTKWHTLIQLQAPEALLGEPVCHSADIWAFACTVFALFDNASLFRGYMPNSDEVLSEIIDALGPPSKRWWEKWEQRVHYFEKDGTKKRENLTGSYREVKPLAARIRGMRSRPPAAREAEQVDEEEMAELQKLLERCLRYEPEGKGDCRRYLEHGLDSKHTRKPHNSFYFQKAKSKKQKSN